jgi:hypothetical protein
MVHCIDYQSLVSWFQGSAKDAEGRFKPWVEWLRWSYHVLDWSWNVAGIEGRQSLCCFVPRALNVEADRVANMVLDSGESGIRVYDTQQLRVAACTEEVMRVLLYSDGACRNGR